MEDIPIAVTAMYSPTQGKRRFTLAERFGVWVAHGQTCVLCNSPITKIDEVTIDHYFPEHLRDSPDALARVIEDFSLPSAFDVDSFANWVPAHWRCNLEKGSKVPVWSKREADLVRRILGRADRAKREATRLARGATGGKLLTQVLIAIQARQVTLGDLLDLVNDLSVDPSLRNLPAGSVFLESGEYYAADEIAATGTCRCERAACVGRETKVFCIFTTELSEWVVRTGLYHACYDEVVACPRCDERHPRGHIGRRGSCRAPYVDQERQAD